ncbi:M43 family zinc metalloprotease [Dyadobacter tibetensis]|uniref:M43 family zinc metalloprotease n=1 Tax=Dyadobacter tibetensis TaxID=1211851 RepID=UPI000472790B|nr:M43 family zinc metalloprotease [Dyadobacter tibetensis]
MWFKFYQKYLLRLLIVWAFVLYFQAAHGQRCATMPILENKFEKQPSLRSSYELQRQSLTIRSRAGLRQTAGEQAADIYSIPVVVHVVVNGNTVSDAAILAQLDTLNKDFNLQNAGLAQVLPAFQKLSGNAGVRFCLAQKDPNGQPTSGIVRYSTPVSRFNYLTEDVKYASRGGADAWDTDRYLNIWICGLSNNILGYASFPGIGPAREQGVVVDYASLPGGGTSLYSGGKTLTHEMGHFFSLFHIWGDDDGGCNGSDDVDDTPNQANSTSSCKQGEFYDICNKSSPGIMYQNFMDYSPDVCLSLFTLGQVNRMRQSILDHRMSLVQSDACTPPQVYGNDASLEEIIRPAQRLCSPNFTPQIRIKNKGSNLLQSLQIYLQIDEEVPTLALNWEGSLRYFEEELIDLPPLTLRQGDHILKISLEKPNNLADGNTSNDERILPIIYYEPFDAPIMEGFETSFLSAGWDIVNKDQGPTWELTSTAAKSGLWSVRMQNFNYSSTGQADLLRTPSIKVAGVDSAFVAFDFASSNLINTLRSSVGPDTLSVLVSADCGLTYQTIYKRWSTGNVTRSANAGTYSPQAGDWKHIELDLADFISQESILVAFKNSNGSGQDIYLDNINLRTVVVNPNLKEEGFLVTPNPVDQDVEISFYPHPEQLQALEIYGVNGKKLKVFEISKPVNSNVYRLNMESWPTGVYIVRAMFTNRVLTRKLLKR